MRHSKLEHDVISCISKLADPTARKYSLQDAASQELPQEAFLRVLPRIRSDTALREVLRNRFTRASYLKKVLRSVALRLVGGARRREAALECEPQDPSTESQFPDFDAEMLVTLVRQQLQRGSKSEYALDVICMKESFPTKEAARRRLSRGVLELSHIAERVVFQQFGHHRLQEFIDAVARLRVVALKTAPPVLDPKTPRGEVLGRVAEFEQHRGAQCSLRARKGLPYKAAWVLMEFERGKSEEKIVDDLAWQQRQPGRLFHGELTVVDRCAARGEFWCLISHLRQAFPTAAEEARKG